MRTPYRLTTSSMFAGALLLGAIVGVGSVATSSLGRADIASSATRVAVATGVKRLREPQAGDYWHGCRDARAAGTAPIYRGEPGYRPEMDGDSDGIACEPYHG